MLTNLTSGIVRIIGPTGATRGAGFVVSNDGLIVTCSHVIQDWKLQKRGHSRPDVVTVIFLANNERRQARLEHMWWRGWDVEDVAFLQVEGGLPDGVQRLLLGSSAGTDQHPFRTYGFSDLNPVGGVQGDGRIMGPVPLKDGIRVLQLNSEQVAPGFSGAPIWDCVTRRVVGMVSTIVDPAQLPNLIGRSEKTVFITPTESLYGICSLLEVSAVCPYRGLESFKEEDGEFFFGRRSIVETLIDCLRQEPGFLAVFGASGSGKSSLVQAGLIPQLRQGVLTHSDRWEVLVSRPTDQRVWQLLTDDPSDGLNTSVEQNDRLTEMVQRWLHDHPDRYRLVLVLDQFEELLVAFEPMQRQMFISQLHHLLSAPVKVTVVLVMRDDFYSRLGELAPELMRWVQLAQVYVPRKLDRQEVTAIIQEPARLVGLEFEPGLVEAILNDAIAETPEKQVGRNVGQSTILPLLEFALTFMWEKREDGVLTHKGYEKSGRVAGALTQWADAAFRDLKPHARDLAQRILVDLVYLGDPDRELPDIRQRRSLTALERTHDEPGSVHQVVQQLADTRLLVSGKPQPDAEETVEIIHDALLREWRRLKQWIDDDRQFLMWRQSFEQQVQLWVASEPNALDKRNKKRLLSGDALVEAERWQKQRNTDLRTEERAFIQTSVQTRKNRRMLALVGLVTTIVVISLISWAWWLAQTRAENAANSSLAQSLVVKANDIREQQPAQLPLSVLLAIEAVDRLPSPETIHALRAGTDLLPHPISVITSTVVSEQGGYASSQNISPLAQQILALDQQKPSQYTAITMGQQWQFPGLTSLAVSSKYVATVSGEEPVVQGIINGNSTVQVWERANGHKVFSQSFDQFTSAIALSPSNRYLATGGVNGVLQVWDLEQNREVVELPLERFVSAITFSNDEKYLTFATGPTRYWRRPVRPEESFGHVWDLSAQAEVMKVPLGSLDVSPTNISISPNKLFLMVGSSIWRIPDGQALQNFEGQNVVSSADGVFLALTNGPQVYVWQKVDDQEFFRQVALIEHEDVVVTAFFSPDSNLLATVSQQGTARIIRSTNGQEISRISGIGTQDITFSPNGKSIVTYTNNQVTVWDIVDHYYPDGSVTFSPTGRYAAAVDAHGIARIWEPQTGYRRYIPGVSAIVFSADEQYVAIAYVQRHVEIWNLASGVHLTLPGGKETYKQLIFSADGKYLAGAATSVQIWDVAQQQEVARLADPAPVKSMIFSSNGRYLLTVNSLSLALTHTIVWDIENQDALVIFAGNTDTLISPNGKYIIISNTDTPSRIWNSDSQADIPFSAPTGATPIMFSPDSRIVALYVDDDVMVWDIVSNHEIMRIEDAYLIGINSDGSYAGVVTKDEGNGASLISIWDIVNKRRMIRINQPLTGPGVVAFSQDGRYVATASGSSIGSLDEKPDNTVYIWEITTGQEVTRIDQDQLVHSVQFAPNDYYLLTKSGEASASDSSSMEVTMELSLWRSSDIVDTACARLDRNLNWEEWKIYLPEQHYRKTCENLPDPVEPERTAVPAKP